MSKTSTAVLPYQDSKILMQLRDEKDGILYPGHWGFLGGAIEKGETPWQGAKRELYEEIGYVPDDLIALDVERICVPDEMLLYSFYCPLKVSFKSLTLYEGFDLGLFSVDEIRSKRMFSTKADAVFPVIDLPCINKLVEQLMQRIGKYAEHR